MSESEDIPEDEHPRDIWEIAHDLSMEWAMPETEPSCRLAIARAILAERERCARIAQQAADEYDGEGGWVAARVVTAIRRPTGDEG